VGSEAGYLLLSPLYIYIPVMIMMMKLMPGIMWQSVPIPVKEVGIGTLSLRTLRRSGSYLVHTNVQKA
jgi:hypothetical protein